MHEEHGGDISKILTIEGSEHRPKRRVAGMTMGGLRRQVTMRKPKKEDDDCTVYASAKYGATPQSDGGVGGGGNNGINSINFELKRRNLVADMTARSSSQNITWSIGLKNYLRVLSDFVHFSQRRQS